jgi:hypothetical protein
MLLRPSGLDGALDPTRPRGDAGSSLPIVAIVPCQLPNLGSDDSGRIPPRGQRGRRHWRPDCRRPATNQDGIIWGIPVQAKENKMFDMVMLTATGGEEQTASQYGALLDAAGFRMTRVVPTASLASIVEAVPR